MDRSVRILLAAVSAVVSLAAVSSPAEGWTGAAATREHAETADPLRGRPALAKLLECARGRTPATRGLLVRGVMRQVEGGATMQMRIQLEQRAGRNPRQVVPAPGLGVWKDARPGVQRFSYRQRVIGLARAITYRAVIDFRWYDEDGVELAHAQRRTPPCRQRGELPNLVPIGRIEEDRPVSTPDRARYSVRVKNRGHATARRIQVVLVVDGVEVDGRTLRVLHADEARVLLLSGPVCDERAELHVDPADVVTEVAEDDNVRVLDCSGE